MRLLVDQHQTKSAGDGCHGIPRMFCLLHYSKKKKKKKRVRIRLLDSQRLKLQRWSYTLLRSNPLPFQLANCMQDQ